MVLRGRIYNMATSTGRAVMILLKIDDTELLAVSCYIAFILGELLCNVLTYKNNVSPCMNRENHEQSFLSQVHTQFFLSFFLTRSSSSIFNLNS